ncbi:SigE family RNA polymerase sigma factor [Nocardioides sp. LS1]|uniref:SigE family RNA polymerase sigma factor n=1 Tax=Nocardioides sp. LS1 TaxID=1027620 RepID=UPI000F61822F|nr:SigE family RNA polymerase sigma factor [Nocardioides sp. LS1]GCD92099.1 RNA polymerase sigma factor [Nocardioides sp. LS1]
MAARSDFEEWLVAREPSLQRLALLLTGDPHSAQDLVQTSLAKLYLAWDRLEDREHLDGYARRVLVNEHRSAWRRPWRRREVVTAEVPDVPTSSRSGPDVHAEVWAFVATLPPRQRAVLVLRYYEELTEAETADVLGISVGTVKSQASRALAALRSRLADHPEITHPGQEES